MVPLNLSLDEILDALAARLADRLRAAAPKPAETPAGDRFLTPRELAERWACSDAHVRDLVRAGRLRARRDGRRVLIAEADAAAYLSQPTPKFDDGVPVDDLLAARERRGGR